MIAETWKVTDIWRSGKDDSHFENFCHYQLIGCNRSLMHFLRAVGMNGMWLCSLSHVVPTARFSEATKDVNLLVRHS